MTLGDASRSADPSAPTPERALPRLSNQQRALLQALEERGNLLAVMYAGGVTVLCDTGNPDRFSLCAHAIRELMEKLPECLDAPTMAQKRENPLHERGGGLGRTDR
jgi:hypothetical protein